MDYESVDTDSLINTLDEWLEEVTTPDEDQPDFKAILAELRRRVNGLDDDFCLPIPVVERIRDLFGHGQKTFDAFVRRIRFAYRVWLGKYGPWTPEQGMYAEELILWALDPEILGSLDAGHRRALAYTRLDRIVHHEKTHLGFKARGEHRLVDVTIEMMEAL